VGVEREKEGNQANGGASYMDAVLLSPTQLNQALRSPSNPHDSYTIIQPSQNPLIRVIGASTHNNQPQLYCVLPPIGPEDYPPSAYLSNCDGPSFLEVANTRSREWKGGGWEETGTRRGPRITRQQNQTAFVIYYH